MDSVFEKRFFNVFAVAFFALAVILAYSNSFQAAFQFDDIPQIVENRDIRSLANMGRILSHRRAVTVATFALNYAAGGLNAWGWHAVNAGIHIVNASLAYFLLTATLSLAGMGAGASRRLSFFASLIFALHPVNTQAVTYIIQRMESLSALFYLLSIIIFIKAGNAAAEPVKKYILFAATGLSYALAFYSKETAFTLPAVILLYDFYFLSGMSIRPVASRWPAHLLLWVLFAVFALSAVIPAAGFSDLSAASAAPPSTVAAPHKGAALPQAALDENALQKSPELPTAGFALPNFTPRQYLYTQFNVIVYYMTLLFVPANQNLDYDFPLSRGLFESPQVNAGTALNIPIPPPFVSLIILAAVTAVALYLARRPLNGKGSARAASFFIFWFFVILSPTSSFIPILDVIFEHRMYLASIGFITAVVIGVDALISAVLLRRRESA